MEPIENKIKVYLGEFPVVEVKGDGDIITVNVGRNVHITMHLRGYKSNVKAGQTLPLFTEIPYADSRPTSVQ